MPLEREFMVNISNQLWKNYQNAQSQCPDCLKKFTQNHPYVCCMTCFYLVCRQCTQKRIQQRKVKKQIKCQNCNKQLTEEILTKIVPFSDVKKRYLLLVQNQAKYKKENQNLLIKNLQLQKLAKIQVENRKVIEKCLKTNPNCLNCLNYSKSSSLNINLFEDKSLSLFLFIFLGYFIFQVFTFISKLQYVEVIPFSQIALIGPLLVIISIILNNVNANLFIQNKSFIFYLALIVCQILQYFSFPFILVLFFSKISILVMILRKFTDKNRAIKSTVIYSTMFGSFWCFTLFLADLFNAQNQLKQLNDDNGNTFIQVFLILMSGLTIYFEYQSYEPFQKNNIRLILIFTSQAYWTISILTHKTLNYNKNDEIYNDNQIFAYLQLFVLGYISIIWPWVYLYKNKQIKEKIK